MIAYLNGFLFKKSPDSIIIDANGIGYEVFVPLSTFYKLPNESEKAKLHIYTHVREDALTLYGFHTKLEKNVFVMLISVSGIGPRLALNILSGIGPRELLDAVSRGDGVRLRAIPGVGKKTAERIALELRDRAIKVRDREDDAVLPALTAEANHLMDDALSALLNLGYSSKSAKSALEKAGSGSGEMSLEGLIRESLKILA